MIAACFLVSTGSSGFQENVLEDGKEISVL